MAGSSQGDRRIAFKFQSGTQWVHLQEEYGNWRSVNNRLRIWVIYGTWERVFIALMAQADADEVLYRAVSGGLHDRPLSVMACRDSSDRSTDIASRSIRSRDHG